MWPWTKRLTRFSLVASIAALPLSRQSELAAQPQPAAASETAVVTAVRGVEVVVSDLSRSRAFFELLGFWQIDLDASKAAAVWSAATASGGRGVTQTTSGREALVRDRDGHASLVTSAA